MAKYVPMFGQAIVNCAPVSFAGRRSKILPVRQRSSSRSTHRRLRAGADPAATRICKHAAHRRRQLRAAHRGRVRQVFPATTAWNPEQYPAKFDPPTPRRHQPTSSHSTSTRPRTATRAGASLRPRPPTARSKARPRRHVRQRHHLTKCSTAARSAVHEQRPRGHSDGAGHVVWITMGSTAHRAHPGLHLRASCSRGIL